MKVITVGKRLIPAEQIALVEPFDPSSTPDVTYQREFKGRILLVNHDYVLTEQTPAAFAEEHAFTLFTEDTVALNPGIAFKVETFEPTDDFKPTRPYVARVKWKDPAGKEQSKLLVTAPELVIAELTKAASVTLIRPTRRASRGHSGSRCKSVRVRVPIGVLSI
jgi:hypothetical protein